MVRTRIRAKSKENAIFKFKTLNPDVNIITISKDLTKPFTEFLIHHTAPPVPKSKVTSMERDLYGYHDAYRFEAYDKPHYSRYRNF